MSSQPCRWKCTHVVHGLVCWLRQTTLTRGSDPGQAITGDGSPGKDGSPRTDQQALSYGTRTRWAPRCVAPKAGEAVPISLKQNEGGRGCECGHLSVHVCVCVSARVCACSPAIFLKGDSGTPGVGKEFLSWCSLNVLRLEPCIYYIYKVNFLKKEGLGGGRPGKGWVRTAA